MADDIGRHDAEGAAGTDGADGPADAEAPRGAVEPADGGSAELAEAAEIGELVGRLVEADGMDRETRGRLLARLVRLVGESARRAGVAGMARGRWLTDLLVAAGPHIPVRDLDTLRAHHRGLAGEALADSVARVAGHATTAVGAAGGALAAVQFTAPPLLLTAPAQLAAETLVVAAIEVKMIAELHEVYGVPVAGSGTVRAASYLTSWARRRGIDPLEAGSLTGALGTAAKAALRKRLLGTFGRSMTTVGPFLTGAAAGAALNRASTRRLAADVRADLRRAPGPVATAEDGPSGGTGARVLRLPPADER
ncbi:hypothetical protein [Actinomadura atramentaria]|uniref:hypothetical protein n=1 Tax=Actinomadura atramentaria TaxID=1990 RepID=UPI0003678315|nr:hypothetical protein [Actinomadura atramentaria]